ncbi:MAG: hypothetical protein KJP25_03775 [Gammaproteobacteria bacterium]|nr:hypothetical protein [Gammaproteobacteria bacterium]MBT8150263.1 hypothetical protein [Gammaproteobacteria bacterium]NND39177.1 hypothetical protein [Pseudomonadales bacterium]NNL11819.1 hypothetical protein [Pseudomonadales bacterium]NNM12502.1 hypothetical protein [Pseudomonadales bacterium]
MKSLNSKMRSVLLVAGISSASQMAVAQDNTLDLKSTFKGNQEQPKVMYIVPWQSIQAPPASYRPVSSLISENFQLVDREEFQRNVHFSDRIQQARIDEKERFERYRNSLE